jgi:cellulose synthase/poly-beta-1,6-N-acetylglucosamine synthase-like glycosyltransferase
MIMAFLFSLILLFYSYLVFPLILVVFRPILSKPWDQKNVEPFVSIVVSAYNEEDVIREKIENALSLDYPADLLEILVSSDGSTDRTNEIVSSMNDPRITFYPFLQRSGKTSCLNKIVPAAKGDIILFTDANSILPTSVLRKIVRNFADQEVGLVTGWTKYKSQSGGEGATSSYAQYEKVLKKMESAIGSCVGADGAIFAIRKELYQTLRDDDINDFVIPLNVIQQEKRVVLDPDVYCFEEAAQNSDDEYRRQVRITARTLRAIRRNMEMLRPQKFGMFSFFMFSHKVMRFLTPIIFLGVYLFNAFLFRRTLLLKLMFLGQNLFLLSALAGNLSRSKNKILRLCNMLIVTFAAQCYGWIRMIKGVEDTTWTPRGSKQ